MSRHGHLGLYLPGPSLPAIRIRNGGCATYPRASRRGVSRQRRKDPWSGSQHGPQPTGALPSIVRSARFLYPHQSYSRHGPPVFEEVTKKGTIFPYRTAHAAKLTIEDSIPLSHARAAPSKRNSCRHTVLYTHDSPFISAKQVQKQMTQADFDKLNEKYGIPGAELIKFHKLFSKLQMGKGVDEEGMVVFLGKAANICPTDKHLLRRLFELTNKRGQPTISFEQVIGLLHTLRPPEPTEAKVCGRGEEANVMGKVDLFFNIVDTNESGAICMREVQQLVSTDQKERVDFATERRKTMVEKMFQTVYEALNKTKHGTISRNELHDAVEMKPEVYRFFLKGLFLVNLN